jgi:hypothetical protein
LAELSLSVHYVPELDAQKIRGLRVCPAEKIHAVRVIMLAGKIEMAIGEGFTRFFSPYVYAAG